MYAIFIYIIQINKEYIENEKENIAYYLSYE